MRVRVELHADDLGQPRPQAIHFDSRRIDVAEMLDQWYGPDYRYIKVRSSGGDTYILKLHETHTDWELTMFARAYTRVTAARLRPTGYAGHASSSALARPRHA